MRRTFRTTTALVTSLSLILPGAPAVAQETALICPDGTELPCPEGVEPVPAPAGEPAAEAVPPAGEPDADAAQSAGEPAAEPAQETAPVAEPEPAPVAEPEPAPDAVVEPAPEPSAEPAPAEAVAPEETTVAPETAAEPAPAEEPAAEPAPEVQSAEEPAAEPAPEAVVEPAPEAAPAEEPAAEPAPEPAPEAEPVPEAAPEATVTEEPAAEPAPEAAPEAVETEEPVAAPEAEAAPEIAPAEAEPATGGEAPAAEPAPGTAAEPEAESAPEGGEAAATGEAVPETTEAAPEAPTAENLEKALAGEDAAAPAAETVEVQPTAENPPPLPEQPDAASGEAPVAAAADLLAPAAEDGTPAPADAPVPEDAVAQVTEETVTSESARSSDEDFANKVNQSAPRGPTVGQAPAVVEKKDGLSDVEKLLLLGAGALVVGAIISNNRKVEMNSGDRVVVSRDGSYELIKDDDALLRQPGSKVRTETFRDGSTRSTVLRTDGTKIVTIRDAEMRVLRRVHVARDGRETLLIDDTLSYDPVDVALLPAPKPLPPVTAADDDEALRAALAYEAGVGRRFSLAQIRNIREVRALMPVIDLDAITFDTGSAAIKPAQAKALARLGRIIQSYVRENPAEVFLIEGHTDAVGSAAHNLALSDRRAESVALAMTEYFGVPPENMVVQGYGEEFLKVQTQGDERANRRASVRRITGLMR